MMVLSSATWGASLVAGMLGSGCSCVPVGCVDAVMMLVVPDTSAVTSAVVCVSSGASRSSTFVEITGAASRTGAASGTGAASRTGVTGAASRTGVTGAGATVSIFGAASRLAVTDVGRYSVPTIYSTTMWLPTNPTTNNVAVPISESGTRAYMAERCAHFTTADWSRGSFGGRLSDRES